MPASVRSANGKNRQQGCLLIKGSSLLAPTPQGAKRLADISRLYKSAFDNRPSAFA